MPIIPNRTPKYNLSRKKNVHTALDVAGMIPGVGVVPDIANSALYASEGKFLDAALAGIAAIPVYGISFNVFKRGKKSVKLYRGITGKLKDTAKERLTGKIFGESPMPVSVGGRIYTTTNKNIASTFADKVDGNILEFEVPMDYIRKHGKVDIGFPDEKAIFFDYGIPSQFLKKVTPKKLLKHGEFQEIGKTYEQLLKDKKVRKSTIDDMLETMSKEIDNLEDLLK